MFVYNNLHVCLIHYRELQFVINGLITDKHFTYKGVPQGSILSPVLFNLYVAKCCKMVMPECKIVQFADDIAIFTRSSNLDLAISKLERSVNKLVNYLESRGLSASPEKSALVIFTKKKFSSSSHQIRLNNSLIPHVSFHKFLGVTLDSKMSGLSHARNLERKGLKLINVIRSLRGV